jgi:DNA-binding HxlR family transcriptional regulator
MDKYPLFCYVLTNMKVVRARAHQAKRVFSCPVEAAQDVIGGKWKPIILWHLHATKGPCRFGTLRRAIPNATEKMIVQQLRELESTGIIRRRVFREVPPRVEYSLTEEGKDLREALEDVCEWGERYAKRIGAVIRKNLPPGEE